VKHLGDITKVNGAEIEPVNVVTFGSPCQDLSVAGLRKGLDGERSGLFMEAVRIIKEMRENEHNLGRTGVDIRPRFAIWENVPGAFSSNNGEDFRVVLEELAHIIDKTVTVPKPKDKWKPSGLIIGDSWSIAWRTMDAQYWGVPQRRKRIALVLDCAGECAGEILFESESVSGNIESSIEAWQGIAKRPTGSVGECGSESEVTFMVDLTSL
jgi:DNA (cytosine-5)-methyltransferase 1